MLVIKNQKEIDIMRKAGEIHGKTMLELKKHIYPGIKTIELDKIAESMVLKHGAYPSFKGYKVEGMPDFPGSICTSLNEQVIHGIPGEDTLQDGDIVSIDLGVYFDGYHADGARTFPVGTVSESAQKLIEVTKHSFFRGMEFAKPGLFIRDISCAIQDYVESYGYTVVRDFVGHGIGETMHEEPQIPNYRTSKRGPKLEKGMTLAIEPMVNEGTYKVITEKGSWKVQTADGKLSAHYENTIVITDDSPLIITLYE
jgi:methionyl aminopeptidase